MIGCRYEKEHFDYIRLDINGLEAYIHKFTARSLSNLPKPQSLTDISVELIINCSEGMEWNTKFNFCVKGVSVSSELFPLLWMSHNDFSYFSLKLKECCDLAIYGD